MTSEVGTDLRAVRLRALETPRDRRPQFELGNGAFRAISQPRKRVGSVALRVAIASTGGRVGASFYSHDRSGHLVVDHPDASICRH